jgi:hypothetical protein
MIQTFSKTAGVVFTEAKSGINDPGLIKDDSFVLISSLSGPNDLDEETKPALSLAAVEGRLMIPANSVRLSSLPKIVYEFHKFPVKNPGLLDLDYFISIISTL